MDTPGLGDSDNDYRNFTADTEENFMIERSNLLRDENLLEVELHLKVCSLIPGPSILLNDYLNGVKVTYLQRRRSWY